MYLAEGMQEAIEKQATFTDDAQAAAFWVEGAASVPQQDLTYTGGAGQSQAARLYRGSKSGVAPVLIYIHGGGWTGGSILGHEWSACALAAETGWNVFSISYRFSPAHPFPAGLDDCRAALTWLFENGAELGIDTDVIAIGGASAGANLAIATALASDPGQLVGLLLFYGVFGCGFDTNSYLKYKNGPGLTRARMQDLFEMYDPINQRATQPAITPLISDELHQLPPSCLIAAEHDVLLDDNKLMANALQASGVPTEFHTEPGVTHGFINRGRLVPSANASLACAAKFLGKLTIRKAEL